MDATGVELIETAEKINGAGELFQGLTGSVGTLGVGTLFEVQLMACGTAAFVEVEYKTVAGVDEAIKSFEAGQNANMVFMDAVMFSNSYGIVVNGRLFDGKDKSLIQQRFTRRFDPWLYLHASDIESNTKEIGPMFDYLFRYDRGLSGWANASTNQEGQQLSTGSFGMDSCIPERSTHSYMRKGPKTTSLSRILPFRKAQHLAS